MVCFAGGGVGASGRVPAPRGWEPARCRWGGRVRAAAASRLPRAPNAAAAVAAVSGRLPAAVRRAAWGSFRAPRPPKQRLALSGWAARPEAVSRAWPRPGDACPGGGPRDAAVSFRRRALPPGLRPRGASCPRARGVSVSLRGVGCPASSHPSVVGRLGRTRA
ncbi:progesterone receptor-like [Sus scrofa]|uniref:progesterone receptor-like n=1 Tax=Sus scrofa TaxID=9823 RepID=UPI000A2B3AE4|nr:progesterone receptor-like [Sus scrofa]